MSSDNPLRRFTISNSVFAEAFPTDKWATIGSGNAAHSVTASHEIFFRSTFYCPAAIRRTIATSILTPIHSHSRTPFLSPIASLTPQRIASVSHSRSRSPSVTFATCLPSKSIPAFESGFLRPTRGLVASPSSLSLHSQSNPQLNNFSPPESEQPERSLTTASIASFQPSTAAAESESGSEKLLVIGIVSFLLLFLIVVHRLIIKLICLHRAGWTKSSNQTEDSDSPPLIAGDLLEWNSLTVGKRTT
jgi:hypothetical protein